MATSRIKKLMNGRTIIKRTYGLKIRTSRRCIWIIEDWIDLFMRCFKKLNEEKFNERTLVADAESYEDIERGRRSSAKRQFIKFRRRFKLFVKICSQ